MEVDNPDRQSRQKVLEEEGSKGWSKIDHHHHRSRHRHLLGRDLGQDPETGVQEKMSGRPNQENHLEDFSQF